jgi:hypothetical protein
MNEDEVIPTVRWVITFQILYCIIEEIVFIFV